MIILLFKYLNEVSVVLAILSFFGILGFSLKKQKQLALEVLLAKTMAVSSVPTGLALLVCAFDPSMLTHMSGSNIHIAVAGFALIYLSGKAVVSKY